MHSPSYAAGVSTPVELREIARARLRDAQVLIDNRRFDGAVYLCGRCRCTMTDITNRLRKALERIEAEKGEVAVFVLLLRESEIERWDLIVSAPWIDPSEREIYQYLARVVSEALGPRRWLSISRIVPLAMDDPAVVDFLDQNHTDRNSGSQQIENEQRAFGVPILKAIILVADWPSLDGRPSPV